MCLPTRVWRWLSTTLMLLVIVTSNAYATDTAAPLPAEQAFVLQSRLVSADTLSVNFQIAPGYHLYRDHFSFTQDSPATKVLAPATWPQAQILPLKILGNPAVYSGNLQLSLPLPLSPSSNRTLSVRYQGCSDSGFCYPPFTQQINVHPQRIPAVSVNAPVAVDTVEGTTHLPFTMPSLGQDHILLALLSFFGLGLLLTFTPCVLPMIPILAAIIRGKTQGKTHQPSKGLYLSLTYVLAMALTYAAMGLVLAYLGANVQVWLQQTWLLLLFGGVLVLLALAEWELFAIKLPARLQQRLSTLNQRQQGGSYRQVAAMGVVATLVVSPCVTPPLIAILAYISQVGHLWLGGIALFCLALGMGVPLILVGASQGALLPKAGPWLEGTKILLGLLLLIVAGLVFQRFLSVTAMMIWWTLVSFATAYQVWRTAFLPSRLAWLRYSLVALITAYGLLLLSGVALTRTSWLGPLYIPLQAAPTLSFTVVKTPEALNTALAQARLLHKPVLLDFYSKWCISCQLQDKTTFIDPKVTQALKGYQLLRVDMTKQTPAIKTILAAYHIYAPPQIFLFDSNGQRISVTPLIGEVSSKQLLAALQQKPSTTLCAQQQLFPGLKCP